MLPVSNFLAVHVTEAKTILDSYVAVYANSISTSREYHVFTPIQNCEDK